MMARMRHAGYWLCVSLLVAGCTSVHKREFRSGAAERPQSTTPRETARQVNEVDSGPAEPVAQLLLLQTVPPPRYDVTVDEIRRHIQDHTAVLIDVRSSRDFQRGHVRTALNVPAGQVAAHMPRISQSIASDELIIIYCNGPYCDSGDMVYEYLSAQGYGNMRVYKPGWETLAKAQDLQGTVATRPGSSSIARSAAP